MTSSGNGSRLWFRCRHWPLRSPAGWLSAWFAARVIFVVAAGAPADPDPAFRAEVADPVVIRDFVGLGVDAEGRVTVAVLDFPPAQPGPGLVRFLPDGRRDSGFQPELKGSRVTSMRVLRTGQVLVAGRFTVTGSGVTRTNLARLKSDGSLDPVFDAGSGWDGASQLWELAGGGWMVVARRVGADGVTRPGPHRLSADGDWDGGFAPSQSWAELGVEQVVPRADGTAYLVGLLRAGATDALVRIGRVLSDGAVDPSFTYTGPWVYSAWVTSADGGVYVVVSSLKTSLTTTVLDVLRLQPDGTPDPAFRVEVSGRNYVQGSDIYNPPAVMAMARQTDGRLLLAGKFDRVAGVSRRNVARLEPGGALDLSFNPGSGPSLSSDGSNFGYPVRAMALAADGGVYLGGAFDRYNGRVYRVAVRLSGDPVPRLRVGWAGGTIESAWIGHPGDIVEVESSADLVNWMPHASFTNAAGVTTLPRPNGDAAFLRARWR